MSDYMKEMERLLDAFGQYKWSAGVNAAGFSHRQERGDEEEAEEARTALLDYVRGVLAERDALKHDNERLMQISAQEVSVAPQPVIETEVPMPTKCHPLHKLGQRLAELLDENQWAECERLLLEGWKHEQKPVSAADVPMPEPIGRLYFGGVTCGERDEWEFDAYQGVCDRINESATEESRQQVYLHRGVLAYGVQCRVAGYAAGVAAAQTLQSLRELAAEADAALRPIKTTEVPIPEHVEQLAITRYRPVPNGMFGYKVVAGDGARSVFEGTKSECTLIARKLTEAFLDGAHVAGDAREAAGYAAGVAAGGKDAEIVNGVCPHGVRAPHECEACADSVSDADVAAWMARASLRGEVK